MAIIISSLRAAMDMALNFCCPCLTTRGDPSPPISTRVSDLRKAATVAMDGKEWADADLDGLIDYMSGLLEIVREKSPQKKLAKKKLKSSKKQSPAPTSTDLLNYKEYLTAATDAASAMEEILSANAVAVDVLKAIGSAGSLATAGLLVCATALERFEKVSEIQKECVDLLEEMYCLAKRVRELQTVPRLKEELQHSLKKATELILEASILCCFQIDSSKFARFFKMSENKANLEWFQKELTRTYGDLHIEQFLSVYKVVSDIASSQKRRKAVPIEYPQGTVGMDEPLKRIIQLLKWESKEKALAVVVHGFGGLGKTTLANAAVYATLFDNIEGCQYCMVKLFDTLGSTPNVIDLQTQLIKDLRTRPTEKAEAMPEIKTFEEGQREISRLLDQKVAFIYIDNVLHGDALGRLLPKNMENVGKLRLLLTARDKTAAHSLSLSVKVEFYPIEILPETESKTLIKRVLDRNRKQLNPSEMDKIISICGGVPKLLDVVASLIGCAGEAEEAFLIVKEEWENNWDGNIGHDIERDVFSCKELEDFKEAFLDICSFFQGWDWEELSNIVGKPALHSLQSRGLVTKDVKSMTATVHDIILKVGLRETKKERFIFSSTSEIREFLDQENEALGNIKGIWSRGNSEHPLYISAAKLDLMAASLRVLKLGPLTVVENKCQKNFEELVFFSAGISHLPFVVSKSKKLRHLCYTPEALQNLSQMPRNLRHIDFHLQCPSFRISSNCIKQLKKLRVLRLKNAEFETLPPELGDLGDGLQEITLSNCNFLKQLPESVSTLGSLRVLRMNSCCCLTRLPENFSQLEHLEYLNLSWCKSLEELCEPFKGLSSLRVLLLQGCIKLKNLPQDFNGLPSLDTLDLTFCDMLEGKSIEGIVKLKKLQTLLIPRSRSFLEKWGEIEKQRDQIWSFAVETGKPEEGPLQGKGHFNLTDGEGKAFNSSDLPLNSVIVPQ